jgi:hypothetical protein
MCMSCGCWMDPTGKAGGDGNHPEDSTVMPNVKTTKSSLTWEVKVSNACEETRFGINLTLKRSPHQG